MANLRIAPDARAPSPEPRVPLRSRRRRGGIYILVLLSALIVGATGLAAIQLSRVQNATAIDGNSFIEARTIARSAIDLGMLKIRNDPYWRTNLGNGTWVNNQTLGDGTYSLSAVDPIDGDVTNGDNHPIVLKATGTVGSATYKNSVRLEVGPRIGSCLEVSMISGRDTQVNSATLTSDQTVSANNQYKANNATVNANVEAFKGIQGSTYNKTQTNKTTARDMPDATTALTYYLTNGTTINYSDLPQWSSPEVVTNTSFEVDTSGWAASGDTSVLALSTTQHKDGLYSLLVKSRHSAASTVAQSLPVNSLSNGNTYQLWIPVFPSATGTASATLSITSTGDGVQTFSTPAVALAKDGSGAWVWQDLKGDVTPTWTGTLTAASLYVTMSVKNNYYMDKVSFTDVTYPNHIYVIDKALLSPSFNPYGSQQTNAKGIYIINCSGKDVVIGRSRIVGTLVFTRPGHNSLIQGPVIWEPAVYNFPALLSDTDLEIGFDSSVGIDESSLNMNLNPPGTPYPFIAGVENSTLTDSYPSKITGLVYNTGQWTFSGAPSITGVVIADQNITVNANSLNLNYGNTYLNDPPPGFDVGTVTMKVVPGTWQRSVN
ncbi:MAG TPA: hypothetical protein VGI40_12755 [Pirellulaceae bacterium]